MDISQRNLLELAMSSLPTGLFICDRDGIIRFINDAYANYLRVRPEDAMGRHITDFIPDSGIPAVIASASRNSAHGGAYRAAKGRSSSTASRSATRTGTSSARSP
jgi:PAS domain-containing protein